jgi:CRP/FNR family transcriptional regulator
MPLSPEHEDVLASSPLFRGLGEDDRAALRDLVVERRYARGELIFDQDDPATGFFVVAEGLVKVFRAAGDGRETTLHLVGPPDHFAEAALFGEATYPASAMAAESSTLLFLDKRGFLELITTRPSFALGLFAGMARWLRRLVSLVENLSAAEAPQRLARYLLDLRMQGARDERYVELPAKKHLLAGQLGMSAPTFSRCLAKLENEGLVRVEGRKLFILDADGLDELSGLG